MTEQSAAGERQIVLDQIYIKDLSFESPGAPGVFAAGLDSEIDLNVKSDSRQIGVDSVEVTLTVTLRSLRNDATIFAIELKQAGTFLFRGFTPDERFGLLATFCPQALFPYARAAIATAASKGGFPDLLLQPLDFQALHTQSMINRAARPSSIR